jgi:hypothetical protein
MQILYIKGQGFQATYFDGADAVIWSACSSSAELAAHELDLLCDYNFGSEFTTYVKIGNRIPVPINTSDVYAFAEMWGGIYHTQNTN